VWTREAVPPDWALLRVNIRIAWAGRVEGDRADNLEGARVLHRCFGGRRARRGHRAFGRHLTDSKAIDNRCKAKFSEQIPADSCIVFACGI
jgi:hypothetical protein